MRYGFWTTEKDGQIQRLEAAGFSAAQIADRLGTTRNAVIGAFRRLREPLFPSAPAMKASGWPSLNLGMRSYNKNSVRLNLCRMARFISTIILMVRAE
jgi:hypothetical protein